MWLKFKIISWNKDWNKKQDSKKRDSIIFPSISRHDADPRGGTKVICKFSF